MKLLASTTLSVALLALCPYAQPLSGTSVSGTQADGASERVGATLQAAAGLPLEEAFGTLGNLTAETPEERNALDKELDARLGAKPSARDTLLLCSARLAGEDVDPDLLMRALQPILKDAGDERTAAAAARILADRVFKTLDDKAKEELGSALSSVAKDAERAGSVRIPTAIALHGLGRAEYQREARAELVAFLGSSDAALSAFAALALAEVGDMETPREALQRLARRPDATGALAASYLKQEDIRRLYDRRQKNVLDYAKKQVEGTELTGKADLKLIENVIRLIETSALEGDKVKRQELIDAALDGMLRRLDEHSSYLTPKEYKDFAQDLLEAEYGGIGAYVGEDPEDKLFTIRQPIYSGPAYRAGLHSDDKIVRIGDWPTFDNRGSKPTDEIIKRLKGKPGTTVKLYIWRRGMNAELIDRPTEEMAVEIQREEITIPPVKADLLPDGVALVELVSFTRVASEQLEEKLTEFKQKGLKAVVLDLRQNSGGLLEEARNVAALFLPRKKLVVSTESRVEDTQRLYTNREPLVGEDVPVVVLVSRFSASASEIVSGALQDHGRAVVVGQRTYGKGSVQTLAPVPGERNDEFKDENGNGRHDTWEQLTKDYNGNGEFDFAPRARLTIARYLLPSGRSIHREIDDEGKLTSEGGVVPDEKIDPLRLDASTIEQMRAVLLSKKLRDYLDVHYKAQPQLFQKLAVCDDDKPESYPEFDQLYAALDTTLDRASVRYLLRREVRGRAQDDRGAAFPEGDFQEDPQLQKAIEVALAKLGRTPADVPEYGATFGEAKASKPQKPLDLALSDRERTDLLTTMEWLEQERKKLDPADPRRDEVRQVLQRSLSQPK